MRGPTSEIQIVLCGPKSSGKTVFLTTVFGCGVNVKTADDRTTQILQSDWKRLESGQSWPGATELGVRELLFTFNDPQFKVGLKINDYDGQLTEVLSVASQDPDLAANLLAFRDMVRSASGLIFLFPYGEQTDDARMRKFRDEINTFLTLVEEGAVNREALSLPVALVVNKWDRSPNYGHPDEKALATEFLQSTPVYRDAVKRLQAFLPNTAVYPLAVVRPSGDSRSTPEEIAPHNLLEPIRYIIEFVFAQFESEYREISEEPTLESDKARYILMSGYFKEIRNYKTYGQQFEATEARIAARFEKEFAGLSAKDIDIRLAEESWFFDFVSSGLLLERFKRLHADSLASQFDAGLEKASKGGIADLDQWRSENTKLFERLSEEPEHLAKFEGAHTKLTKARSKALMRRWLIAAAAVPLALFGAWTAYANVDEGSRYKSAIAVDLSSANLASTCHLTSGYLRSYRPGTLHPPLLFVDGNRRKVKELDDSLKTKLADQLFGTLAALKAGNTTAADAAAKLAALQPINDCFEAGWTGAAGDPKDAYQRALESMDKGRQFMATEWPAAQYRLPMDGCADIRRAHEKGLEFDALYDETARAKSELDRKFTICDNAEKCVSFLSDLGNKSDYASFNTLFETDARRQQCIADAQRTGANYSETFAQKRDEVFARIDRSLTAKLKLSYGSPSELAAGQTALEAMTSAVPQTDGIYRAYSRPYEIAYDVSNARRLLDEYRQIEFGGVEVKTLQFYVNADEFDTSNNPLHFDCGSSLYGSDARNSRATFGSIDFYTSNNNCNGSGSSSMAWVSLSGTILAGRVDFRMVRSSDGKRFESVVNITVDDLFRLKADGKKTFNLNYPNYSNYTLVLVAR